MGNLDFRNIAKCAEPLVHTELMKTIIASLMILLPAFANSQGTFLPDNLGARTRIGSTNGPFAGAGYWGQFLVGLTTDSLTPVGMPSQHGPNGGIGGEIVSVPGVPANTFAYIQMVAWDGTRWGTTLDNVPSDQFGRTDIVQHFFTHDLGPAFAPSFTQPAIVPVPEPSTFVLSALGIGALWLASRTRRNNKR